MEAGAEIYLKSIQSFCPGITGDELLQFAERLTGRELNKKDFFLQSGKVQKEMGFIAKGLIRSFYIDNNGNDITVGFYHEEDYATHYDSFVCQTPSLYSIQCLEPTTFICLSYENMQWAYNHLSGFERYGRLVAEEILKRQQARIESFIFQTAEQRYLSFIEQHPTLFNRVSLSHLCSYLGIERQSLTRIRQKLAHQ